jgi:hypothetical protein
MEQVMMDVGRVTDQELIARLRNLVRADRTLSARLLVHLGEVDARGLYRQDACPSMFAYCVEELRILCRCHNSLLAERDFGAGFMRSKLLAATEPRLRQNPNLNSFQNEFSRSIAHSRQAASGQAPSDGQN